MRSACFRLMRKQAISYLGEALDLNQREKSESQGCKYHQISGSGIVLKSFLKYYREPADYLFPRGRARSPIWPQRGKQQDSNEMYNENVQEVTGCYCPVFKCACVCVCVCVCFLFPFGCFVALLRFHFVFLLGLVLFSAAARP